VSRIILLKMTKALPYIIVILLCIVVAWVSWDLKPPEYIKGSTKYVEVQMPVDSSAIISEATVGRLSYAEFMAKYGKDLTKIRWKDSLNLRDSTVYDTIKHYIPTLSSSDTARFSGFQLLNLDTIKYSLMTRVNTIALLEPVNAIETKVYIDSMNISIPEVAKITLKERLIEGLKYAAAGALFWELIR